MADRPDGDVVEQAQGVGDAAGAHVPEPATRPRVPPAAKLPMLDGLRGVAALLVLLTHCAFATGTYGSGAVGAALARFDFGVALFFALSGFLLTRPWAGAASGAAAPSLRRYTWHRLVRILPAYWVALAAVLWTLRGDVSGTAVASNALLLQVYTGDLLPGFTQTWSLCTEVAFYAVLPLVAPSVLRGLGTSARRPIALLGVAVALAWLFTGLAAADALPWGPVAGQWLPAHLDWFAVGVALAVLERRADGRAASVRSLLTTHPAESVLLAVLLFAVAATPAGGPLGLQASGAYEAVAKEALYAGAAGLLVGCAAFSRPVGALGVLASRPARWLGMVSYAVFLWHLLVLETLMRVFDIPLFDGGFLLVTTATIAVTLVIAAVSWLALERPLLRWVGARTRL